MLPERVFGVDRAIVGLQFGKTNKQTNKKPKKKKKKLKVYFKPERNGRKKNMCIFFSAGRTS